MQKISILYDDEKQIFHISNNKISYIMELKENTLLHRYWGHTLQYYTGCNCTEPVKRTFAASYNQQNPLFSLEIEPQEFSCPHQGDYREPSISVRQQNGCTIGRMKYQYYEITDTLHIPEGLPHIREMKQKAAKTLAIHFLDMVSNIKLILYYSMIEQLRPGLAVAGPAAGKTVEFLRNNIVERLPVDIHEVTLNIQLEQIAFPLEIVRARADMVLQASDAEMGAHSLAARITVCDERTFEQGAYVVAQQMVHYAIAKVSGENLAFYRYVGNETYAAAHAVAAFFDFMV